ncbi:MAG: YceD family protein [Chloroflexia bacterium]
MLKFNVAQLLLAPVGTTRSYDIDEAVFYADEMEVRGLHGHVLLTRLREDILLQGTLDAEVTLECSRCLERYVQPLHMEMELEFQPSVAVATGEPLPPPEDDSVFVIDGQHILDLTDAIREQIILNLPMRPLCHDDCLGLCPICGQNLNEGPCPGHGEEVDARLSILGQLLGSHRTEE